jgi:hypothetical protein
MGQILNADAIELLDAVRGIIRHKNRGLKEKLLRLHELLSNNRESLARRNSPQAGTLVNAR